MIVFRQRFKNKALKLDQYLHEEFGETVANRFLEKVNIITQLLIKLPELGRKTKIEGIRSKLIPPYTRIYYSFKKGRLEILNMYDVRQSPKKNMYE
jgi:plasmid stabilization system protein ParE